MSAEIYVACDIEPLGGYPHGFARQPAEKVVAPAQQFWPQRSRPDFGPGRDQLDRDDDIALDLHDPPTGFGGDLGAPPPLRAQIAAVADDERCPLRQFERHLVRAAAPDRKTEPARPQHPPGFGETVEHKGVMPGVRLGIIRGQAETDQNRQAEPVRLGRGNLERRVERGALGVLHPIKNVVAGPRRPVVEDGDALGFGHSLGNVSTADYVSKPSLIAAAAALAALAPLAGRGWGEGLFPRG